MHINAKYIISILDQSRPNEETYDLLCALRNMGFTPRDPKSLMSWYGLAESSANKLCKMLADFDPKQHRHIISDGWRITVLGIEYYVEDGWISRGVSVDGQRTLYAYEPSKYGGLDRARFRAYYRNLCKIHWA